MWVVALRDGSSLEIPESGSGLVLTAFTQGPVSEERPLFSKKPPICHYALSVVWETFF